MTNLDNIIQELSKLKVLEMKELTDRLMSEWGVSAAPVGFGGGAAPVAAVEQTEFDVILESVPADKKIGIVKVVREMTSLGLLEAKKLVESAPKSIKDGVLVSKEEAEDMKKKLEAAGAEVKLK